MKGTRMAKQLRYINKDRMGLENWEQQSQGNTCHETEAELC